MTKHNVIYLHRATIAGRDTCTGACETRHGCNCAALDACAPEGGSPATHVPGATGPAIGARVSPLAGLLLLVALCWVPVVLALALLL